MAETPRRMQVWTVPPDTEIRRMKTMVEDELMIKLGAKKETIEFHPLILAQCKERPKTSFTLDYRRVKPPYQEKLGPTRNPWGCSDQALRQVSSTNRQGPRKLELPTLSSSRHGVKRMPVLTEDEEYKKLRVIRLNKRDEILEEWSALQLQAFAVRRINHLALPDIEPLRRYSSASFSSIRSLQVKKPQQDTSKKKPSVVPFTHVPPTGGPKSRWRGMARQLLWNSKGAQMRLPEELPRSEVRIYLSCTQDLSEEREFLAEVAYPELRRFCEKKGLSCHIVDFRHGSNRLKNNRETFDLIEREIGKCKSSSIGPCFASLVGREADDEELPGWLSKDDMLAIRSVLVKREDVAGVEALDNLYRLDSNYVPPIYLLEERFFFAETGETAILHNLLPDVMSQLREEGKISEGIGYYPWSSTVKEITSGLLTCLEPKRQTVCLMARTEDADANDFHSKTGNPSADKLRSNIVDCYNRLGSKNNLVLINVSNKKNVAYLREVCGVFLSAVTKVIERQISHYEFDISHHLTNAADVVQHVLVARQTSADFLGGETIIASVQEMLINPTKVKTLVVAGREGAGRTAITSLISAALSKADPLRKVVFRVLGITLTSSSLLHLVRGIYFQVAFLYELVPWLPADITVMEMLQAFRDLLQEVSERASQKGPLTVVLDGVDKLPGIEPNHLGFLVGSIPFGTMLVMSTQNSGPLLDTVKSVTGTEVIECKAFMADRTEAYITSFLSRRSRIVNRDQMRAIMRELYESNFPLVARIAASMASRWPSHTLNDDLDISADIESAFHSLVESCEVQLGLKFTRYVLSLLVASRYGLAEHEILHIISTDTEFIDETKEEMEELLSVLEGYPYQLQLSRILVRLEPFLYEVKTEGETILRVIHSTLKDVVHARFLQDGFKYRVHKRLATYFQFTRRGHLLSSRDVVEGKHKELSHYLWRTFRSVPYHLCHSEPDPEEAWKKLKSEVFMKFSWIINEIYAGFFNDFIDDLNYALETLGLDSDILFLRQFLCGVRQTVVFNPVSLASLLAGQDMKKMEEMQKSVTEAQEWLKQVHLQVLVPTPYTTQKSSQLQVNAALAKTVTAVVTDKLGERVILQYDKSLTSYNQVSGEESTLTTFKGVVNSTHLWGQGMMTIVTTSSTGQLVLDTYALDKGRHMKSTCLTEKPIRWLQVRSDGTAFYAAGSVINRVLLEKDSVSEQFRTKEPIHDACVSESKQVKAVILHREPKTVLHVFDARHPEYQGTISLQNKLINETLKPLSMTKDFTFAVVACEREILIVDVGNECVTHSKTFSNVPVSLTAFSRSHEHVFVVTPTRLVQCFKLNTGTVVMAATLEKRQPPPADQMMKPPSPRGRQTGLSPGRSRTSTSPRPIQRQKHKEEPREELITTITTSEDDHFLLAATTLGHVYILHVPTNQQVCVLSTGGTSLRQIVYFSSASWFQHLVTVDYDGLAKLWNLRPLVSNARSLIMGIIKDKDLLKEEEVKQDLALYFSHFKERRFDRMYLNGPDISAFYKKPPPAELFGSMNGLDPALQTPTTWQATGCLGDCPNVCAVATGTDLSEVLLTATSEGDLARWSLTDGTLLWLRPCPSDGVLEWLRPVYYDQALCFATKKTGDTFRTVTVLYPEDTKKPSLVEKKVSTCQLSADASTLVLVCTKEKSDLQLAYWNLIAGEEQRRVLLTESDPTLKRHASSMTFANNLSTCAMLVPEEGQACSLYIWTVMSLPEEMDDDEEERPKSGGSSKESSGRRTPPPEFQLQTSRLQYTPTAIGFDTDGILLIGTSVGLTLIVTKENLKPASILTTEGVETLHNEPLSVIGTWSRMATPHSSGIKRLADLSNHVILSASSSVLCLWNLLQKRLILTVLLNEEEFLHHVISRDLRVLTFVTSSGILAVWGVKEKKQLCSFRLPTRVSALSMTLDCRRAAVLLDDDLTSRVRVFDIRNIDDIRVEPENSRKVSKESEKEGAEDAESPVDEEDTGDA